MLNAECASWEGFHYEELIRLQRAFFHETNGLGVRRAQVTHLEILCARSKLMSFYGMQRRGAMNAAYEPSVKVLHPSWLLPKESSWNHPTVVIVMPDGLLDNGSLCVWSIAAKPKLSVAL